MILKKLEKIIIRHYYSLEEIEVEQKKAEDLKALRHSIFSRDKNDDMYKIENVEDFYFQDGAIYVIFAYGNDKYTSEVDVAII